jgi:hypothetical protein
MKPSWLGPASAVAVLLAASAMGACAAGTATGTFTNADGASGDTAGTQGNGGATSGTVTANGGNTTFSGLGGTTSTGTGAAVASAYAHTNDTLFSLDPTQPTLALKQIGKFSCIGGSNEDSSMTDLAVNETGDIWAISSHNVYPITVSGSTVSCGTPIPFTSTATFYGLTFAPKGVIDPNKEVLVAGNTAGELWAIDTSTSPATITQHGTLGLVPFTDGHGHTYKNSGKAWELSGDIVFLANGTSGAVGFATVRDCPTPPSTTNCNTTDTLIEINTGALLTAGSSSVLGSVRGQVVKATGCNVLGFSHQGFIVNISNIDGTACLVLPTNSDDWAGAAITTVAPVKPPPT